MTVGRDKPGQYSPDSMRSNKRQTVAREGRLTIGLQVGNHGCQPAPHCGKPQTERRMRVAGAGLETRCRRGRPPHIDRSTRIVAAHEEAEVCSI